MINKKKTNKHAKELQVYKTLKTHFKQQKQQPDRIQTIKECVLLHISCFRRVLLSFDYNV